jgi:hypothetical protein
MSSEIFLEEKEQVNNELSCPYCSTKFLYLTGNQCGNCENKFTVRTEVIFYFAKDCERNGETHDFKPEPTNPEYMELNSYKEICTKCEAQRCK